MHLLYLVGAMVATTEAIGGSALQVFITHLVGRERLVLANSKVSAASSVSMVVGPALAAALVALVGAPLAITADALSFVCSALLIASIGFREQVSPPVGQSLWAQVREGLQLVWRTPMLRGLVAVVALWIILSDSFKALYVLHAARNLGLGAGDVALINTLGALGGLAGAPLAHFVERRLGIRNALVSGVLLAGLGYLAYTLPQADWRYANWMAGLALLVFDCGSTLYVVNYLSLRQAVTPDAFLGRMVTSMRFVTILPGPLGTILIGHAADRFGLVSVFIGLGVRCLAMGLVALRALPRWQAPAHH